ncbi:hypothetical protein ACK8HY_22915 [Sphingobacterium sp. NGMCC 1.201703]|uniref:hypothetical protein n=1 Tax=Sphingobacterium sp. NGMCC 1.201703 TaxID=3388657 RepID=UPI0039FD05FF
MISKKIIKRSLITVGSALTLVLGIAFAVNAMEKKISIIEEQPATQTYYYQLNSTTPADVNNRNNYALTKPGNGQVECGDGIYICEIQDTPHPSDATKPAMSLGNVTDNPDDYEAAERPAFSN